MAKSRGRKLQENGDRTMEKLTFDRLILIGIVLIVVGHGLAFLLHAGFLVNLAWILYGSLCLLHPVCPERWKNSSREKNALLGERIAGVLCIVIGLLTRFVV